MINKIGFMISNLKKYSTNILLIIVSVFFTLIVVEISTRVYLELFAVLEFKGIQEFRKSKPLPYKDSKYDVEKFVKESFRPVKWNTPENTRLVIPENFSGEYINISDGIRRTSDKPLSYSNNVYIFGGSTVFCHEVPDIYTIGSFLQREINEIFPDRYRVLNYGATSVVSSQELERLKTVEINSGDVVVFFDGANDVFQSIYNGNPDGWIIGENKQVLLDKGKSFKYVIDFYTKYCQYSKFVEYFLSPYDFNRKPAHLNNQVAVHKFAEIMYAQYTSNIVAADSYATSHGALFFHFLQPTLYSGEYKSMYEFSLRRNPHIVVNGVDGALDIGYFYLKKAPASLNGKYSVKSFDISGLFDSRSNGDELFIDWVHVSEKGNELIANAILKHIQHDLSADINVN